MVYTLTWHSLMPTDSSKFLAHFSFANLNFRKLLLIHWFVPMFSIITDTRDVLRFKKLKVSLKLVPVCKQNCTGCVNAKWFCCLRNGDVKLFTLHDFAEKSVYFFPTYQHIKKNSSFYICIMLHILLQGYPLPIALRLVFAESSCRITFTSCTSFCQQF